MPVVLQGRRQRRAVAPEPAVGRPGLGRLGRPAGGRGPGPPARPPTGTVVEAGQFLAGDERVAVGDAGPTPPAWAPGPRGSGRRCRRGGRPAGGPAGRRPARRRGGAGRPGRGGAGRGRPPGRGTPRRRCPARRPSVSYPTTGPPGPRTGFLLGPGVVAVQAASRSRRPRGSGPRSRSCPGPGRPRCCGPSAARRCGRGPAGGRTGRPGPGAGTPAASATRPAGPPGASAWPGAAARRSRCPTAARSGGPARVDRLHEELVALAGQPGGDAVVRGR